MRKLVILAVVALALTGVAVPKGWADSPSLNPSPTPTFSKGQKEVKANFTVPSDRSSSKRKSLIAQRLPKSRKPVDPLKHSRLDLCIEAARSKAAASDGGIVEFLCHMRYGGAKPDPTTPDFAALARSLAVYLRLPDTNPRFGPDPDHNEWHMLAVGYPVWLWTDGPTRRTATATAGTLTFHLTATRTGTTFDLGDGHTLHCTKTTPYPTSVKPGSPSPTCGHVYTKASTPGRYTVTATAHWQVNWSVDGFTGTFPMSYTDTSTLAIGELQALVR